MTTTRVYLDTEFNGFGGDLISIALVTEGDEEFYAAIEHGEPCSFAQDHIIPVLDAEVVTRDTAALEMVAWLRRLQLDYPGFKLEILADWPEDFIHFLRLLIIGPGRMFNAPDLTMRLINDAPKGISEIPHNAVSDARAMRDAIVRRMKTGG